MIKAAIINILRTKSRSLPAIAAVATGVCAFVLISSMGSVGAGAITATLTDMGINSILVQTDETSKLTLDEMDLEAISHINGVEKAMPLMASFTESTIIGNRESCLAWGVSEEAAEIISLSALHGRLITDGDVNESGRVCVIDETVAISTYGRSNVVGKTACLLMGGRYYDFKIVGIANSGLSALQNALGSFLPSFVYVPISTMQELTGRNGFDKIAVLTDGTDDTLDDRISKRLSINKDIDKGISVTNLISQKSTLQQVMSTAEGLLGAIGAVSMAVSGITIMITMLVAVTERRREIGIRKSIGARNSSILLEFMTETGILTLTGCFVGIFSGLLMGILGCMLLNIDYVLNIWVIILSVLLSFITGGLFGIYPALTAARMDPITALRE